MNTIRLTLGLLATAALAQNVAAQENLLAEKQVFTLGPAKTWVSNNDVEYTFVTDDLAKLTQVPANTANIYLFPEAGAGWNNEANKEIGIQGFYVDLGSSQNIGVVTTTWEGAAANAFDIYVTDEEPTLDILNTTPTYSASGLGQYSENSAVLPNNSKGRYLVMQPTDATNWGWGVKIRSISASAPVKSDLTSFAVSPAIVLPNEAKAITLKALNQFDLAIQGVTYSVSDNATLDEGILTITSGDYATLTATYDGVSLEAKVYAATQAPALPSASSIATPIFTNTDTENNGSINWTYGYNGGATNYGLFNFEGGEVAQGFGNTRCVFFNNTVTTPGGWNAIALNPEEAGYKSLCLDIFSANTVEGNVTLEGVQSSTGVPVNNPFNLKEGEWNNIVVDLEGVTNINNMSIRFNEQNMCDILLANIYFSGEVKSNVAELEEDAAALEVYNLQGIRVAAESIDALPAGLYIINGKKTVIR